MIEHEFHHKYRPKSFKQVIGQEKAVSLLNAMRRNYPHAICLTGPSGVGKTTLARILRKKLGCGDNDYKEINAASSRGVDTVREIESKLMLSPINGKSRVIYLDEAHRLTRDAQSALLKMLEDPPRMVYFILATTEWNKLLSTIQTRCTRIALSAVDSEDIRALIERIIKREKLSISDSVIDHLVEASDGSARRAVIGLQRAASLKREDDQIEAIDGVDRRKETIDLVRYLMGHKNGKVKTWAQAAAILQEIKEEEIEIFRRQVLGYAKSVLIGREGAKPPGTPNKHAYKVIVAFSETCFDTGKAGLVAACLEVLYGE